MIKSQTLKQLCVLRFQILLYAAMITVGATGNILVILVSPDGLKLTRDVIHKALTLLPIEHRWSFDRQH